MQEPVVYMLDTVTFNDVLDGKIDAAKFLSHRIVATHIQMDELRATRCADRREKLLAVFSELTDERAPTPSAIAGISVAGGACASAGRFVPTSSGVWGVSRFGQARWSDGTRFSAMLADLNAKNRNKRSNTKDILIAETALQHGWSLVTRDAHLTEVITQHGGTCCPHSDFSPDG